jgi:hypothetical protein
LDCLTATPKDGDTEKAAALPHRTDKTTIA